jgi:hypothetical protein
MSLWTSRIKDHLIWDLLKGVGPLIDQAEQLDDVEPESVEALERLRAVLAFCGKRLGGIDPLVMSPASLDSIALAFDQQKTAIEAFISDRNPTHLTEANHSADVALVVVAQIPGLASPEELISLIDAVNSYRAVLDEQLRSGTTSRRESRSRIEELTKSLEEVKTFSQTTLTELKTELEAERKKISLLATEQQKAFAEAQETRVNTLAKTLTDQQGQFSAAQEARSRDFTTAQTESQKRLSDVIADYTKRLADQDSEFAKQRTAFVATANEKLSALNEDYDKKAKVILDEVNQHRSDVEKLVGVIGSLGVTSGYQTTANRARISMWVWQGITVVAMCGLIYFAYHAFLPSVQGAFHWESFAARVFLTITVGVLAAYAGAQADRFFHMEKSNRKLALELAAIDPFIALLPQAEQDKLKLEVGRRTFAQEEAVITTPEKSPATTLDLLNSDSVKQIISLVNAIKGK